MHAELTSDIKTALFPDTLRKDIVGTSSTWKLSLAIGLIPVVMLMLQSFFLQSCGLLRCTGESKREESLFFPILTQGGRAYFADNSNKTSLDSGDAIEYIIPTKLKSSYRN